MLRSFRVANHRSIRDEQELSLLPAYDKQRPVVPVAAIYGANASGKSNLLDALRFMQTAVRSSYRSWEPGTGVPRHPYRLDPSAHGRPSLYAIDLAIGGVRFAYGFTLDDQHVTEEWLYTYPQSRRRLIFERQDRVIRLGSTLADHRSRESTLNGLTRDNALFLSTAAHANQAEVMPVYDWFRDGMVILSDPSSKTGLECIVKRLEANTAGRTAIIDLVRAADLGISDIRVIPPDGPPLDVLKTTLSKFDNRLRELEQSRVTAAAQEEAASIAREARAILADLNRRRGPTVTFLQGQHGTPMTADEQSTGTRAWISLLAHVLSVLERGSLLVIDEIDTSLHPRLTARLIEMFRDERSNPNNAQLVFVTHDASLLGTSFGRAVLERDQIWFIQKDDEGGTVLFPLTDFHPRKEENTERRYLGGSYGAVPAVFSDSLVDAYLSTRPELVDDPT